MFNGIGLLFPSWKRIKEPDEFSKLLDRMAKHGCDAAAALERCFAAADDFPAIAREVATIEEAANETAGKIHRLIDRTYIPPFDDRDIDRLTSMLDDVVDAANLAVAIAAAYSLHRGKDWEHNAAIAQKFVAILKDGTAHLSAATQALPKFDDGTRNAIRQVRLLRSRAANLLATNLPGLIGHPDEQKAIGVLGWKDVYLALEKDSDHCRQAADLLRSMARMEGK